MPSFIHGLNGVVFLHDTGGTCRNVSGDLNSVTLSWTRDNPDTTTLSKVNVQRITGIRDATLTGAGIWNADQTPGTDDIFSTLMNASNVHTLIQWAPAGCAVSGCPVYSGCFQISQYEIAGPVNGPVAFNWSFQLSSGSVTTGCVA